MTDEKLWNYARMSHIWARMLILTGLLVLCIAVAFQIGQSGSQFMSWCLTALITVVATTLIFLVLLRSWMRASGLPSSRLPDATPNPSSPRRLEATDRQWRAWGIGLLICLTIAGVFIMGFLTAVLGGGGLAEGVVVGVFIAWGVVTARDVARVAQIEMEQQRTYYAACKRPVSVGSVLVWQPRSTSSTQSTSSLPEG